MLTKNNKKFCVYVHIFPNGKKYFGITSKRPTARWDKGRGYKKKNFTSVVWNAIQKYGWDNIQHKVLYTDLTEEEAKKIEQQLIAMFKTNINRYGNNYGYNMTDGGEGTLGHKVPENLKELGVKMFSEKKGKNHYKSIPLICDDKEWECISDFCKENKVTYSAVVKWLTGENNMPVKWYNKHLRFKDENLNLVEIKPQIHPFKNSINYDGRVFESQKALAKYLNISPALLCKILKGEKPMPQEYYDKGLKLKDSNQEIITTTKTGKNKVEYDGKIYNSQKELAQKLNINETTLVNWLNGKTKIPEKIKQKGIRRIK